MPRALRKPELLDRILSAVDFGGWRALVTKSAHPFALRIFQPDSEEHVDVDVFIWNISHGGGAARPADELRIQLTGAVPAMRPPARTLLLGWDEGYGVFVGFDARRHHLQASSSPSIQVGRDALLRARRDAFGVHMRGNRETVVAFRPEFFVEYVRTMDVLHQRAVAAGPIADLLNSLPTVPESAIEALPDKRRREVLRTLKRRFREHDFSARILAAYAHRCAMCGMQMKLVEAAHILPVAADRSTDETSNGVALCSLHHRAFDANLVSFDERYAIELSASRVEELRKMDLADKLSEFRTALLPALALPADRRDYPNPRYISASRTMRRWQS